MDLVIEENNGTNDLYSSISHYTADGIPITDKVSLDLDSRFKEAAFPDTKAEDLKIDMMREDSGLAKKVLGEVIEDARKVASWTVSEDLPFIGVFTGFGIHLHILYKPTIDAKKEITSISTMLKEKLDIETMDRVVVGDTNRLMRIPNCARAYKGRSCQHFCIPLTADDILTYGPRQLLNMSESTRRITLPEEEREVMMVYEDYSGGSGKQTDVNQRPVDESTGHIHNPMAEAQIEALVDIPCIRRRLTQPDPHHFVRFMGAIHLFNKGLGKQEVFELMRGLNWVDWDPSETRTQLKNIWKNGYAEMSCESLQAEGLCLYSPETRDDECDMYEFPGGRQEYK